ncbi:MAG: FkbM family methyltransferase [Actinomycetota bacterium]|nr:FkbM family methyltransferase [Actinomycetota bacterium]
MASWRQVLEPRVQTIFRRLGFEVRRFDGFGIHPLADVRKILAASVHGLIVFDVGANTGQTIRRVRDFFPEPVVHAFEPSEATFAVLQGRYGRTPEVHLNRVALGSVEEERPFFEHESSSMSSFLPLGLDGWGAVQKSSFVPVTTIDAYCHRRGIDQIDLLKIDTQGFELEVLAGATRVLGEGRVTFVLLEVNFAPIYEGSPSFHDLSTVLFEHGFVLVSLYNLHHVKHRAGWADALFTTA